MIHKIAIEIVRHMDMDHYFEPEFDFSQLDPHQLRDLGVITISELESVMRNWRTRAYNLPGSPLNEYKYYAVGISPRARCLVMLLNFENDRYYINGINWAHEEDIETLWCERRRR